MNYLYHSAFLIVLTMTLAVSSFAQALGGEVVELGSSLKLKGGKTYPWSDAVAVKRGEQKGGMELLQVGDRVQLMLDAKQRVKAVSVITLSGAKLRTYQLNSAIAGDGIKG